MFGFAPERSSPYARIGTAVHSIVEQFLRGDRDLTDEQDIGNARVFLAAEGLPAKEIDLCLKYCEDLRPWRPAIHRTDHTVYPPTPAVEHEFLLQMPGFGTWIKGHMDAVFASPDKEWLKIVDHKTNRTADSESWWTEQFQPLLYSWAARQLWPGYKEYWYEIGYVNLGKRVTWQTTEDHDNKLIERMSGIWARMYEMSVTGVFPAIFNDHCGWCPIRDGCTVFRQHMEMMYDNFSRSVADQPLAARYLLAQQIRKAAEKVEAELKGELELQFKETGKALTTLDGYTISYGKPRMTRRLEFSQLWVAIQEPMNADLELAMKVYDLAPELFTVKITGVDALLRERPELYPIVAPLIRLTPGARSLIVKPAQEVELQLPEPLAMLAETAEH